MDGRPESGSTTAMMQARARRNPRPCSFRPRPGWPSTGGGHGWPAQSGAHDNDDVTTGASSRARFRWGNPNPVRKSAPLPPPRIPVGRSRTKLHREFELDIQDLSHDGRGVGRVEGKAVFVSGALPGERVRVRQTGRNRHFDEAETLEVLVASPDRVEPRCPHFGTCAGCVLQHLAPEKQIEAKQRVLMENLARIGHLEPGTVLPPLVDAAWGYRRKGRLSVRFVEKKGRTVVGFRESNPRFVAELRECHTILPALSAQLPGLAALVDSLDGKRTLPQIEFIAGDGPMALVFRHLEPLSDADRERLRAFAIATGMAVLLQPGGVESVQPLHPAAPDFHFSLPDYGLNLAF